MPITNVTKDPENLTMTVVADFKAPLQRLWDAYTDPRQLEKFWGPPEWPATFTRHDVFPGGKTAYVMTGPDGSRSEGYWDWIDVKAPDGGDVASFEVKDGFAEDGVTKDDYPSMRMVFHFESTDSGSRVTTTTHFNSAEDLAQLLEMGMEDGMREAMSQIDDVLADLTSFAHGIGTQTDILSDTQVRITRVIRGSVEYVWRAHHDPELLPKWLGGYEGWEMTICEFTAEVGGAYRYEWVQPGNAESRFGFTGEVLEVLPPHRSVTTENYYGADGGYPGDPTRNELTLTPQESGTLMSVVITYPSAEVRDMVLATGMTEGMEFSYARLEALIAG
jgi:uncharacterized protein YndB with AHSA1/START domain